MTIICLQSQMLLPLFVSYIIGVSEGTFDTFNQESNYIFPQTYKVVSELMKLEVGLQMQANKVLTLQTKIMWLLLGGPGFDVQGNDFKKYPFSKFITMAIVINLMDQRKLCMCTY